MANDRADDLDNHPDDFDDLVRAALAEEAPVVTEAQIQATLSDPTFAALAARTLAAYEGVLTAEALETTRRTLATVFLGDPTAAALLARMRAGAPGDASATKPRRAAPVARKRRAKP